MEDPEARAALDAADAHPAKRLGRRFAIGGAVFVAITLGAAVLGQLAVIPAAGFALVYLWLAREALRMVGPAALLNRAYADVLVGAHESASRLLAALPKKLPKPAERLAASHEAAIALQRGDARRAALQATRAIDLPLGIVMRDWERVQVEYARSIRAMAHATLGEHAAASTDATCARESEHASVATLGKAELARAIVAAGQNRMSDLRDVLTSGAPFFDRLDAKERELVRSLERLVVMPASTVYRRPAKRNDDSPLGAWLAPRSSTVREEPAASAPLPKTSNRGLRTLALWALLVLMFWRSGRRSTLLRRGPRRRPTSGPRSRGSSSS